MISSSLRASYVFVGRGLMCTDVVVTIFLSSEGVDGPSAELVRACFDYYRRLDGMRECILEGWLRVCRRSYGEGTS